MNKLGLDIMNKQNLQILKWWVCSLLTKRQNIYCRLVYNCCRQSISSVTRGEEGGGTRASLIGLKSMQNSTFLVLLRPIFAPKIKTAPPKGICEPKLWRTCRCLDQSSGVFWFWSSPKVGEDLSFGDHLISARKTLWISDFGRKKPLNFGEDLCFCWRSPTFGWKKPLSFWLRPEKTLVFLISAEKKHWISVKTFFFLFFLEITSIRPEKTLEFLISAEKTFQFRWRPFSFFWRLPNFDRKTTSI